MFKATEWSIAQSTVDAFAVGGGLQVFWGELRQRQLRCSEWSWYNAAWSQVDNVRHTTKGAEINLLAYRWLFGCVYIFFCPLLFFSVCLYSFVYHITAVVCEEEDEEIEMEEDNGMVND